jgi:hypothetical protein
MQGHYNVFNFPNAFSRDMKNWRARGKRFKAKIRCAGAQSEPSGLSPRQKTRIAGHGAFATTKVQSCGKKFRQNHLSRAMTFTPPI